VISTSSGFALRAVETTGGESLAAGKTCLITVYFNADDLGLRTATLNFADNAPNSPQGVPLSGTVVKH
jgi:hypothetical protein